MTIDPLQAHREAIADLSRRHAAGDMDRETFLAESAPHARVIVALEADAEREAVIKLVKSALANPLVVESLAIGVAHYLKKVSRPGEAT